MWRSMATMGFLAVAACTASTPIEATDSADADIRSTDNGAGAADAWFDTDPCAAPAAFAAAHKLNLIVAKPGNRAITGTDGNDLIVGTDAPDTINAGKGDDVICAGGGEDTVHGEEGNDYIDGGSDNDTLFGDAGNDLVHGRGGGDTIHGGDGNDMVFGDILDDKLFGDAGDDLIVGGHGTDQMSGGDGNDYLRGDTGNDTFDGGNGQDVASFATAMPPGQPDKVFDGMRVDFTNQCLGAPDGLPHDGCANGDGGNEPLDSIETVIGSPYKDQFTSSATLKVQFVGGYGDDECDGQKCGTPIPVSNKVFVTLDISNSRDVGLIVIGTAGDDSIEIVQQGDAVKVSSTTPIAPGPDCTVDNSGVTCTPKHVLRYIAAFAGDGNDTVKLGVAASRASKQFPIDMTAHVSGGNGDDTLEGGDEQDVLFSGPTGADHLFGNNGDDALLSESRKWPAKDCSAMTAAQAAADPTCTENKPLGADYTDGADELSGGAGDDQLVADYPCGGHLYSGGTGKDVAGFARSGRFDIKAQFTGVATIHTDFYGKAYNPQLCDMTHATIFVQDDMEIMEASDGNDELWGNDAPNIIWGREGDDIIHGLGGDDILMGLQGNDTIYGGAGNDTIVDGSGKDTIYPDAN
jgi:Ca2+-binding RTX toxin-like protein